jgi:hypothetical protein
MSRCASLVTVHAELGARPDLRARLHQPFYWDRQAEHAPDAVPYSRAPIFQRSGDTVQARYYDDYVRKGHALAGAPLDGTAVAALGAMREANDAKRHLMRFWNRDEGTPELEGGGAMAS